MEWLTDLIVINQLKSSLYVKRFNYSHFQNKYVMGAGIAAITFCAGYLLYLNTRIDEQKVYTAIGEDGSRSLEIRTSKWD